MSNDRVRRRWLPGALALVVGVAPARAQDASVRATLDRSTVALNQMFVLSVEISGSGTQQASQPNLPDLDDFALFVGSGSSQSIRMVNGRTDISRTLQYRYQAVEEGNFEIGPVTVTVGGRTHTTEPLQIRVTAAGAAPAPSTGRAGATVDIAPEDLFLRAVVDKPRAFPNEPVIVEYKIYTRVRVETYSLTGAPSTGGFWAEDLPLPQRPVTSSEIFEGRQYTVATLKKMALFPTGTGTKTIAPLRVETEVRVEGRGRDRFDRLFRGGSLFGRRIPHVITSDPVTIEVVPIPGTPPDDFTGLVGDLDLTASLDRSTAELDEALTLRLSLQGTGNLRTLPDPPVDFPDGFEVYPPDRAENVDRSGDRVGGTRTYEYVLIPRAPGEKIIPAIEMSYFDPATRSFAIASTDPLRVVVSGEAVGAGIGPVRRGEVRELRADIRFIHTGEPDLEPANGSLAGSPMFWFALVAPLFVVGGVAVARRHQDRLAGDVAFARHRRASRLARKRLAAARTHARPETHQAFYAETGTALQGFVADKLNMAQAGFLREQVTTQLQHRGVAPEAVDEFFACIDVCDRQRFAPSQAGQEEMNRFLERVEQAMTAIERALSK